MFVKLVFLAILIVLVTSVDGKSMWGSRRKSEKDDLRVKDVPKPAPKPNELGSRSSSRRNIISSPKLESFDDKGIDAVSEVVDAYLKIVEELLESDDFHSVVNPDSIFAMLSQIPGYEDNLQLQELINTPEFSNPVLLEKTVRDGVQMLRMYSKEILDTLKDPIRFTEFLEQLPPEMVELIKGLKNGDTTVLLQFIDNLPGIESSQKSMLKNILNGNTEALTEEINDILGNPDKVEALRQQFVDNPEMASALGISSDLVNDPGQWATFITQGIEGDTVDVSGATHRAEDKRVEEDVSEKLKKLRKQMKDSLSRAA